MKRTMQWIAGLLTVVAFAANAEIITPKTAVTPQTQEAKDGCGAAAVHMLINAYPSGSCPQHDQTAISAAIMSSKNAANASWTADPEGVKGALMSLCPPPNFGQWVIVNRTNLGDLMYAIAALVKRYGYPVAAVLKTKTHPPADASHQEEWVTIISIEVDKDPLVNSSVNVNGLTYIQQSQFFGSAPETIHATDPTTVFEAVTISGSFPNQYVAVIEPPQRYGTAVFRQPFPITGFVVPANRATFAATEWARQAAAVNTHVFRDLAGLTPQTPILVDEQRGGYYLVPFAAEGQAPSAAVIVNAYRPEVMEVARFTPRRLPTRAEAIEQVTRIAGAMKTEPTATLVSSGSRHYPEWRVAAGDTVLFVDASGTVRQPPPPPPTPAYSCEVKVNGKVITTVQAKDRDDCYRQTSFGSENCARYANYFEPGTNLLEQFFNGTDRVNSDHCQGPPPRTSACEVRINERVVQSVPATDAEDCLRKVSSGGDDCTRYREYFEYGMNIVEYIYDSNRLRLQNCRHRRRIFGF